MAGKGNEHRVLEVVVQRVAVTDALQRQSGRIGKDFRQARICCAKPSLRFRRQKRTQSLRH